MIYPSDVNRLILVRHGSTLINEGGHLLGTADPGLSDQGCAQVEILCEHLKRIQASGTVLASHKRRAMETAELIAESLGLPPPISSDAFVERNYGPFEGMSKSELLSARAQFNVTQDDITQVWNDVPGVEQDVEIIQRVRRGIRRLHRRSAPSPGDVLLVTHAGVIKSIVHFLLGVRSDRPYAFRFTLGTCVTISRVGSHLEVTEVWNNPKAGPRAI
jgi:probable phosphoglycerate mutase